MIESYYCLEESIEFWPNRCVLKTKGSPICDAIVLSSSSSKCLELLIMSNDIVLHKNFYDFCWSDKAFEPLPNTLYQNISILRKAFRKLFNSDLEIILTVPRKGFCLNKKITIENCNGVYDHIDSNEGESVALDMSKDLNPDSGVSVDGFPIFKSTFLFVFFTSISLVFFLYLSYTNYKNNIETRNWLSSYSKSNNIDKCEVFYNSDSDKKLPDAFVKDYFGCRVKTYLYITNYENVEVSSIIACAFMQKDYLRNKCNSYIIRGKVES